MTLGSHFGTLDPPGTTLFEQNGVRDIGVLQFFSKMRPVVPLWAPKVTPRVAQGAPKAAPGSLFGHFWTTSGRSLEDVDHFRAPFRSLFLAFGDFRRFSWSSVEFCVFSQIPNIFAKNPKAFFKQQHFFSSALPKCSTLFGICMKNVEHVGIVNLEKYTFWGRKN